MTEGTGMDAELRGLIERVSGPFPRFGAALRAGDGDPVENVLGPARAALVTAIEDELGLPLPASYKTLLGCSAGFWLLGGSVKFGRPFVHEFTPVEQLSAVQRAAVEAKGGAWPPPTQGMVCFADYFWQADGDQVLFDVRDGLQNGEFPVVYYDHEARPSAVQRVAASFGEWLEGCLSVFEVEE
jgi:hypothetical protein